jgi:hypothetical protein
MSMSRINRIARFSVVPLVVIAGCASTGTTPTARQEQTQPKIVRQEAPKVANGATEVAPPQITVIPEGARFSNECARFQGPDHIRQARLAKEQSIRATGSADFFVFHDTDQSVLFYGYYKERERERDPVEAKRAADDRAKIETFKNAMGERMFSRVFTVPIPTANPEAPPEWDLTKLNLDKAGDDPTRKFWTVVVAAYTSDVRDEAGRPADRKKMAIDSVRAARAMGIEAYYYHGEAMSQVCVGAWPRKALREQDADQAESRDESKANSGEALVVSPAPLPKGFAERLEAKHDVKVFQPKVEILDPTLAKTLKEYDTYAVNFEAQIVQMTDPKTGKVTKRPQPSFLTQIPSTDRSLISGNVNTDAVPTMVNPLGPGTTGGLRGLPRN